MFLGKRNGTKAVRAGRLLAVLFLSLSAVFLAGCGGSQPQQNASPPLMRAGAPDFEKYQQLIKVDDLIADESGRAVGDIIMIFQATIRNFTGRTLNGLEVRVSVVDLDGKPVKERTLYVIPSQKPELDNNESMKAQARLEGINKNATRANIKMEVTGFSFK
jgi:hypothetical protein